VPQRFPGRVGAVTGLVGAAGGVGGFVLPFALGSLRGSTGSFAAGFAVLTAAALLGALAVVRRQRAWRTAWALEVAV
jgi:MFS transporter, NNP family, nitrate/nitrite transporter